MSTLSAIVLVYNKAWTLHRFLASLKAQSRPPEQVVVVDDNSSDGTGELLDALPAEWTILRLGENRGAAWARNIGMAHSIGENVIYLDGDIEMEPDMLAVMERALTAHQDRSLAYCHFDRAGSRKDPVVSRPWDRELLERENYISMMSMIRRRDLPVPPFDPEIRRYMDWDLWLRMAKSGKQGVLIDRVLFRAFYAPEDLGGRGESLEWYRRVRQKNGI